MPDILVRQMREWPAIKKLLQKYWPHTIIELLGELDYQEVGFYPYQEVSARYSNKIPDLDCVFCWSKVETALGGYPGDSMSSIHEDAESEYGGDYLWCKQLFRREQKEIP